MALLTRQNRRMDTIGLSKLKTQTIMNSKHRSEILGLWNEPAECSSVQCLSLDTFRMLCKLLAWVNNRWAVMRPSLLTCKKKRKFISFITHQACSTRYGFVRAVTCSGAKYTEPQFPVCLKGKWCNYARFIYFFHWCSFSERMSPRDITNPMIYSPNKTRILQNCSIFSEWRNIYIY